MVACSRRRARRAAATDEATEVRAFAPAALPWDELGLLVGRARCASCARPGLLDAGGLTRGDRRHRQAEAGQASREVELDRARHPRRSVGTMISSKPETFTASWIASSSGEESPTKPSTGAPAASWSSGSASARIWSTSEDSWSSAIDDAIAVGGVRHEQRELRGPRAARARTASSRAGVAAVLCATTRTQACSDAPSALPPPSRRSKPIVRRRGRLRSRSSSGRCRRSAARWPGSSGASPARRSRGRRDGRAGGARRPSSRRRPGPSPG